MLLKRSDRIFVTGTTGSGKTYLARRLFDSMGPPRAVIDPKDDIDATGGVFRDRRVAVTFSDPSRLPDAEVVRFVPRDPLDLDAYGELYGRLFDRRGVYVWTDEAADVFPSAGAPSAAVRLVKQGRARGIGHLALHQRPVEVSRVLLANAEHVVSFTTRLPADVATLAGVLSLPPAELAPELAGLPFPGGFAWYAARDQTLTVAPPIGAR